MISRKGSSDKQVIGLTPASCDCTELATFCVSRHSPFTMNVAVEIPDDVSASLQSKWRDLPRHVLEATAAEAYRNGVLTAHQVGQLLSHGSRWETEAFLKRVQACLRSTEADLERDLAALRGARER